MKQKNKNYSGFVSRNGLFKAAENQVLVDKLPPGTYGVEQDLAGNLYFRDTEVNCDSLVDLPDPAYEKVVNEMEHFLRPETKQRFKDLGYLYKRSSLLHGLPGTGKTSIVNRVAKATIKKQGVVLLNPVPSVLQEALTIIKDLQPEATVLVVFEELDQLLVNYESELLNVLDGEVQKDNVIYLATTNFIKEVPPRLLRPGRFSSVIEVGYPNAAARRAYLRTKLNEDKAVSIASATKGLSIDELKEVVQSTECFEYDLKDTIQRIKDVKKLAGEDKRASDEYDTTLYEERLISRHHHGNL